MNEKPAGTKKEPKEKKAKVKKEKSESTVARPRLPKYPDNHLITVLRADSKARGAKERFQRYFTGQTVRQYVDKIKEDFDRTEGQTFADMRWDQDHKFIVIGETTVEVPQESPQQTAE